MLGHAEAVIDRAIAACRVEPRRCAQIGGRSAGKFLGRLGAILLFRNEGRPILEFIPVATFAHEGFVDETFRHDDMSERRDDRDIRARPQGKMIIRLDMRRAHQVDAARING